MVSRVHSLFKASDRSYLAVLKKQVHALAVSAGFSDAKISRIDIVVAEMVSNLIKHANDGQLMARLFEQHGMQGIELVSIDNGPGMNDVSRMMVDGVSTKNTLGHGFGTMKRMSDFLQVYSQKGWGTIVLCRLFEAEFPSLSKIPDLDTQWIVLPKNGEEVSGDGAFRVEDNRYLKLFLGDGLGHGPDAEAAVQKAGEAFCTCALTDPAEIIRYINSEVKKTRGLVGTVAVLDKKERKWKLCGVGNIATRISRDAVSKNYTSYNGIIGMNVPNTLNPHEAPAEKGQHLIMASDGLKSRWDLARHPGVVRFDPTVMAAVLTKDFSRGTDDESVLVCKLNR